MQTKNIEQLNKIENIFTSVVEAYETKVTQQNQEINALKTTLRKYTRRPEVTDTEILLLEENEQLLRDKNHLQSLVNQFVKQ